MPATDFDTERAYDGEHFSTVEVFTNERLKVVCGFFEPGQFIPVHAPASDVVMHVRCGHGKVRDGSDERSVEPGSVVVVPADTARGIKASGETRLEALLVTSPPPTDAEHAPVRTGVEEDVFDPGETRP